MGQHDNPGKHKGHDKHDDPDPTPTPEPTPVRTTSTMAFSLTPPTLTIEGNTVKVGGLTSGAEYDTKTVYPDGSNVGSSTVVDDAGNAQWGFKLTQATPAGDLRTYLYTHLDPPVAHPPAATGPDGNPLEWFFHYDGS